MISLNFSFLGLVSGLQGWCSAEALELYVGVKHHSIALPSKLDELHRFTPGALLLFCRTLTQVEILSLNFFADFH